MTVLTVANVYGSGSVALQVTQVNADHLRDWAIRMEKTVNDLVAMVTRHESTINLQHTQLKALDAVLSQAKDFMEYVAKAHPVVAIEYHLAREASERLTK